jgi:hypothetical protein
METAELAIIISVGSAAIAAISLGWNIYRDVILKPRAAVSVSRQNIIYPGSVPSSDYIGIRATNHGPGTVTLNTVCLLNTSLWKKLWRDESHAVLFHDYTNVHSSKLPAKLDVGETINLFVNYDKDCFLKGDYSKIGISDSFGKTHWAPKKQLSQLRKQWFSKFSKSEDDTAASLEQADTL